MRFFILRLARFINGFVANVIAQRERQAQLTVLRSLNDRDLMDIGLYRCQIEKGWRKRPKPDPWGSSQENRCRRDYARSDGKIAIPRYGYDPTLALR